MDILDSLKIERTAFVVTSVFDELTEKEYWLSKTVYERLEAMELMRQIIYGYSPSSTRLQRVFAVTQFTSQQAMK